MCVAAHGLHGFRVPDVLGARDELVVLVGGDVSESDELKRSGRVAFSQYQGVGVARSDLYRQDLWGVDCSHSEAPPVCGVPVNPLDLRP